MNFHLAGKKECVNRLRFKVMMDGLYTTPFLVEKSSAVEFGDGGIDASSKGMIYDL